MPRSYRSGAWVLVLFVSVAALLMGSTAGAAGPSPEDVIVLRVEGLKDGSLDLAPREGTTTSECRGFHRVRLLTTEGKNAGTGTLCFNLLLTYIHATFYSLALELHLPGEGKLEAFSGASFVPPYFFEGGDSCSLNDSADITLYVSLSCEGPITSIKGGRYSDRSGWVTLNWSWRWHFPSGGPVVWTLPPTITIDFS